MNNKQSDQSTVSARNRALLERSGAEYVVAANTQISLREYLADAATDAAVRGRASSVLTEGDEIKPEWVGGLGRLQELIVSGAVLHQAMHGVAKPKYPLSVAPGKSLMTRRGVIEPGAQVYPHEIGSVEALESLIRRGIIVRTLPTTTATKKRGAGGGGNSTPPEAA
jgi:hypothetical protein